MVPVRLPSPGFLRGRQMIVPGIIGRAHRFQLGSSMKALKTLSLSTITMAVFTILPTAANAGEVPVKITNASLRAVPPASRDTAAYFAFENTGTEPIR